MEVRDVRVLIVLLVLLMSCLYPGGSYALAPESAFQRYTEEEKGDNRADAVVPVSGGARDEAAAPARGQERFSTLRSAINAMSDYLYMPVGGTYRLARGAVLYMWNGFLDALFVTDAGDLREGEEILDNTIKNNRYRECIETSS